jgi:GNAT superfamily N-acetyltransferase
MLKRSIKADAKLHSLPPGYKLIPVQTTYLEMRERPAAAPIAVPAACEVKLWEKPGAHEYLELFTAVGGEWGWSGRLILQDEELRAVIQAKKNEIFRLYCEGKVAGFAELDRRKVGQTEISYFGLLPGFIGRGLGKFLLSWTIQRAWQGETERVWLHTCQYDHAGALAVYRKAGFRVYDERIEMQPYAEEFIGNFLRPADD